MSTTDYDYTQDIGYYRFAAMSCSYVWTRILREAGADYKLVIAYHEVANNLWSEILSNYVKLLGQTPVNTRVELGELELKDLVQEFEKEILDAYTEAMAQGDTDD